MRCFVTAHTPLHGIYIPPINKTSKRHDVLGSVLGKKTCFWINSKNIVNVVKSTVNAIYT